MGKIIFKNIFFDFDGVILDSVECKTRAFQKMYSKFGNDITEKVKKYHLDNGGISRYEKFKFWHKEFLNINLNNSQIHEMANKFSAIVLNEVINSAQVPGAISYIKNNYQKKRMWIITGTPTDEMKLITKKLGIDKYFEGIHGSPEKKTFWTEKIINQNNLVRGETLFIGDATTDYEASYASNINFALRLTDYNRDHFIDYDIIKFKDFHEFKKMNDEI